MNNNPSALPVWTCHVTSVYGDVTIEDIALESISIRIPGYIVEDKFQSGGSIITIPDNPFKEPNSGYVYLLRGIIEGYKRCFKIGRSGDPSDRYETFKLILPFDVMYEHTIVCRNMIQAEAYFHLLFDHRRIKGEWFALEDIDLSIFKSIHVLDNRAV